MSENLLILYQAKNGAIELRGDVKSQTMWASQSQMAELFGVNPQAITKHLKNIYNENELSKRSTCSKMEQVQKEGDRVVKRKIEFYNLDAIISVGYRISSVRGTRFRKWATKTLKQHLLEGYTINKQRIGGNYDSFMSAVAHVKALLPSESRIQTEDVIELIEIFATTWLSLDAYDKGIFPENRLTEKQITFTGKELAEAVSKLKHDLFSKGQATNLFAQEKKSGSLESIVGSVFQSAFGEDAYPSMEEKAAHLLYFIVKNHPFNDGNKRTGAFSFVWFLSKVDLLQRGLTPEALTSLTLLIAESNPKEKEKMVGLVLLLINKK